MTRPHSTDRSLHRFCPFCGSALQQRQVSGRLRRVCPACGHVQYRSPVVGVAAVIEEAETAAVLGGSAIEAATGHPVAPAERRVLLGRRSASYAGLYCLPCGYVEFDEEIREALVRETEEETGLIVEPGAVLAVHSNFHDPDHQSVGVWFRAQPAGGILRPGDDIDALVFVPVPEPGVPLAFPTDARVLAALART